MKTHPSHTPHHPHPHKGGALISTISIMLILSVLGVSVISLTSTSQHSFLTANANSRAYYLAESGLRYAQKIFCTEGWLQGRQRTLTLDGGDQVKVVRIGNYFWATSVVNDGTAMEARARVPMIISSCGNRPNGSPTPAVIDEFAVFGDVAISLGKNTIVEGNVGITDNDVDVRGDVLGSILAEDVFVNGQGSVNVRVAGGIYSSGMVSVRSGTVEGDIQAAAGISINSSEATIEGWLFSNGAVDIGGGAEVLGHIHACGADISIGSSATVGSFDQPIEIRTSGSVHLSGYAIVYGTIYAGGDITFSGSPTIVGGAFAGGNIGNGSITGDALQNSPTYLEEPICPYLANLEGLELPEPTEFTAGGQDVNVPRRSNSHPLTYTLLPGTYGDLSAPNNSSNSYTHLLLKAGSVDHAEYYFDSISLGNSSKIYLDLSGSHDIRIFVEGDVSLGTLEVFVSTNGINYLPMSDPAVSAEAAARVYIEPHGNFDLASPSYFFGSVYTPYGNLSVGNSSQLYGSYYSGGGHNIIGSTIIHVAPNYYSDR